MTRVMNDVYMSRNEPYGTVSEQAISGLDNQSNYELNYVAY